MMAESARAAAAASSGDVRRSTWETRSRSGSSPPSRAAVFEVQRHVRKGARDYMMMEGEEPSDAVIQSPAREPDVPARPEGMCQGLNLLFPV